MKSGDVVFHIPSGETWLLAYADEEHVSPCGWPESMAKRNDCILIRECSEEESNTMVQQWASKPGSDHRIVKCRELLVVDAASSGIVKREGK